MCDAEEGLLTPKTEMRRPALQTAMLTKWLIILAITSFVLLDVYLVDVVVSRAAFRKSSNVHTVVSSQHTIQTQLLPSDVQPQTHVASNYKVISDSNVRLNVAHDSHLSTENGTTQATTPQTEPVVAAQTAPATKLETEVTPQVNKQVMPAAAAVVDKPKSTPAQAQAAVAAKPAVVPSPAPKTKVAEPVVVSSPPPPAPRHISVSPELLAVRLANRPMFVGHGAPPPDNPPEPGRPAELPVDFDWQAYLEYNPDLKAFGVSTAELSRTHFLSWGYTEARVYARMKLLLRYTACGGLMNQHYSHIAAMTLATYLGADIAVPPAVKRDSFANYFSTDAKLSKISWHTAPFNSLWDEEYIFAQWEGLKNDIGLIPEDAPHPNLAMPRTAYQTYQIEGIKPEQVVQLDGLYVASQEFTVVIEKARRLLVERAVQLHKQVDKFQKSFPPLVLDMPCMLFSLRTNELPLATIVARQLRFSPYIQELADKVVAAMESKGVKTFHGLHLRVEQDAVDWAMILGGRDALWARYLEQCAAASMNKASSLYIATGLLSYSDQHEMNIARQKLAPYAKQLLYKELYLGPEVLSRLHPEQQALIDFLVLVRSHHFVGISVSTFSVFIREYRHIHSIQPRTTSFLVDGTRIGTEPLFARSAVLP